MSSRLQWYGILPGRPAYRCPSIWTRKRINLHATLSQWTRVPT